MAKWIRKVKHDLTNFRVSIPAVLISELGWESCRYVTIEKYGDGKLLIRRLPGDGKQSSDSTQRVDGVD